ncbi:serine/threonine-protein kinase [Tahibacter harae]|uniref:Protein kinase n=1 Tax=Tahibacter harae TaxID=2963937 RepID=A0ABT1QLE3_9GAMM|nr:serine/threonine-protein kinase [Tahibacter harae]MCQ4163348.1 protein kinase [Tahibacter harae]
MPQATFQRLRHLFNALADLTPEEREAFLAAQQDLGADTRRQLQQLLQSDEQLAGVTVRSAMNTAYQLADAHAGRSGERIGAYTLRRQLGSGGMGSVHLAERSEGGIVQQVAIKIVHPEQLDATTLARFRLERQVLALLRHPHIASMLDLGELEDGSPYAVIEFVDGVPITVHAREKRLDLRQRLHLLLAVCDAVAHAHRNMIVHRDLKPSNVLVDADGHVKLLDFGIAKPLISQFGAIDVEQTATAQRFLSPSHAAPEQFKGEAITTACDVYGLGSLLYELLCDQPPFSTADRTPGQLEREICEVDPPPPSRRRAADASIEAPPRDLDLIALRCLRKQPADRYSSVEALAQDLRNYLAGRPVEARRGSFLYRTGRFVSRHRSAVALSAVIVGVTAVGFLLLAQQNRATTEQRLRADEMTGLIIDALRSADPSRKGARDLSAREVFERVAGQVQAKPDLSPQSRASLISAIARIDLELGLPRQAEALLDRLDAEALSARERDQARNIRARVLMSAARYDEARLIIASGLAEAASPQQRIPWQIADTQLDFHQGKIDDALKKIDAVPTQEIDAETSEDRLNLRAQILLAQDRRPEALEEFNRLLAAQRKRLGRESPAVFETLGQMVVAEVREGNFDRAEPLNSEQLALAERLFDKNSVRYGRALSTAQLYERYRGNYKKALEYEYRNNAIQREQYGEPNPALARSHFNLAGLHTYLEEYAEADAHFGKAISNAERVWLPSDGNLFLFRLGFAVHLAMNSDRPAEAQKVARVALNSADTYPELKTEEIYLLGLLIDRYGDYSRDPSKANRAALIKALDEAIAGGKGISYKRTLGDFLLKLKTKGIEPTPAATAGSPD